MSAHSKIEWTDATWNPIVGCSIASTACADCYAMADAWRKGFNPKTPQYHGLTDKVKGKPIWNGKVAFVEHALTKPLHWRDPHKIFVNSMGDLFHESVPDEWIDRVFAVMALAPQHTFQVLTKRAERMREYLTKPHAANFTTILDDGRRIPTPSAHVRAHAAMCELFAVAPARALNDACAWQDKHHPGGDGFIREWPLPNVWLGVSAERQQEADERIPHLLQTPAAVRFLSAEPLLGPIDLTAIKGFFGAAPDRREDRPHTRERTDALRGSDRREHLRADGTWNHRRLDDPHGDPAFTGNCHPRLDWVIAGGESGKDARPMHPDWARSLRDQCAAAGVPFFFKQWGEWAPSTFTKRPGLQCAIDVHGHVERRPELLSPSDTLMEFVGKKRAGRLLDGVTHDATPRQSLIRRRKMSDGFLSR